MKVWVFTGTTESGDEVGPYVFDYCPSTKELQAILMKDCPSEFEGDPPNWVDEDFGYISSNSLEACEVRTR